MTNREKHKQLCAEKDKAEEHYNSLHREAKAIKQHIIFPLENEIRLVEHKIRVEQKSVSFDPKRPIG